VKRLPGFSQPASSWRCFIDWLANPVLVLKKNNTWRMCIDYTSLNKACPKDPFVLPPIDQVIDSIAGCDLLSFLDAYSGYHQISLYEPDKDVVHHPIRSLLLCHHAFQLEERQCNLPTNYATVHVDTSQTYLKKLMLDACFYTICLVFCYTSWRFYAFSGTNLLTRCHSVSSLFSAIFVF
jgi:hypothetical protein